MTDKSLEDKENESHRAALESAIVGLASGHNPEMDIRSVYHPNDNGDYLKTDFTRRTDDINLISITFEDDDTSYDLAVSSTVYDTLKSTLETCEDFQDVFAETVIDGDMESMDTPEAE